MYVVFEFMETKNRREVLKRCHIELMFIRNMCVFIMKQQKDGTSFFKRSRFLKERLVDCYSSRLMRAMGK